MKSKLILILILIIGMMLSACTISAEATPVLTNTVAPTSTKTLITTNTLSPTETLIASATPTATFTPTPALGDITTRLADGMNMIFISSGEFEMGTNAGTLPSSRPIHTVYLDSFWIDETEITNDMFQAFVQKTDYETDVEKEGESYFFDDTKGKWDKEKKEGVSWQYPQGEDSDLAGLGNYPVIFISRHDAEVYCSWAGARLPTEAEWEKAARGGLEGKKFPWGDGPTGCEPNPTGENHIPCYRLAPIKTFGPNDYGLYDMAGNVMEWISDISTPDYYKESPYSNPHGTEEGLWGMRGGAYMSSILHQEVSTRGQILSDTMSSSGDGFRCARSATP